MKSTPFVIGLYDLAGKNCDRITRVRLRDLSLSWARFGYQGPVIEGEDARSILVKANEAGYEYCLLLGSGTIFDENWYPAHWGRHDLLSSLTALMDAEDFVVAGHPLVDECGSRKIDRRCLLVNLRQFQSHGQPALDDLRFATLGPVSSARGAEDRAIQWLVSDPRTAQPISFREFDSGAAEAIVHLLPPDGDNAAVAPFLGTGIQGFDEQDNSHSARLSAGLRRFLAKIHRQVEGAKRGVFPWNLETYDDVDLPPPELKSPLRAVYGVAAGFKPYRILHTHGFDRDTRVVLFDYSARALEFRQWLLREWDGTNYPAIVKRAFHEMPRDTYFQLWAGLAPEEISGSDLDQVWRAETDRWGGEGTFQEHWNFCRSLPHEFIQCDLLESPGPLLARIRPEPDAVVWWSNAFFTIYSNWFFSIADRRRRYKRFIDGLAACAPALFLYGADHVNNSVNSIQADEYAALMGHDEGGASDGLIPARFHRLQIRS